MFVTRPSSRASAPLSEEIGVPKLFYGTGTAPHPVGIRPQDRWSPLECFTKHPVETSRSLGGATYTNNNSGQVGPLGIRTGGRLDPFMVTEVGSVNERLLSDFRALRSSGKLKLELHAFHQEARESCLPPSQTRPRSEYESDVGESDRPRNRPFHGMTDRPTDRSLLTSRSVYQAYRLGDGSGVHHRSRDRPTIHTGSEDVSGRFRGITMPQRTTAASEIRPTGMMGFKDPSRMAAPSDTHTTSGGQHRCDMAEESGQSHPTKVADSITSCAASQEGTVTDSARSSLGLGIGALELGTLTRTPARTLSPARDRASSQCTVMDAQAPTESRPQRVHSSTERASPHHAQDTSLGSTEPEKYTHGNDCFKEHEYTKQSWADIACAEEPPEAAGITVPVDRPKAEANSIKVLRPKPADAMGVKAPRPKPHNEPSRGPTSNPSPPKPHGTLTHTPPLGGDRRVPAPTACAGQWPDVCCDGCGSQPLEGTRYQHWRRPNFSLCGSCLSHERPEQLRLYEAIAPPPAQDGAYLPTVGMLAQSTRTAERLTNQVLSLFDDGPFMHYRQYYIIPKLSDAETRRISQQLQLRHDAALAGPAATQLKRITSDVNALYTLQQGLQSGGLNYTAESAPTRRWVNLPPALYGTLQRATRSKDYTAALTPTLKSTLTTLFRGAAMWESREHPALLTQLMGSTTPVTSAHRYSYVLLKGGGEPGDDQDQLYCLDFCHELHLEVVWLLDLQPSPTTSPPETAKASTMQRFPKLVGGLVPEALPMPSNKKRKATLASAAADSGPSTIPWPPTAAPMEVEEPTTATMAPATTGPVSSAAVPTVATVEAPQWTSGMPMYFGQPALVIGQHATPLKDEVEKWKSYFEKTNPADHRVSASDIAATRVTLNVFKEYLRSPDCIPSHHEPHEEILHMVPAGHERMAIRRLITETNCNAAVLRYLSNSTHVVTELCERMINSLDEQSAAYFQSQRQHAQQLDDAHRQLRDQADYIERLRSQLSSQQEAYARQPERPAVRHEMPAPAGDKLHDRGASHPPDARPTAPALDQNNRQPPSAASVPLIPDAIASSSSEPPERTLPRTLQPFQAYVLKQLQIRQTTPHEKHHLAWIPTGGDNPMPINHQQTFKGASDEWKNYETTLKAKLICRAEMLSGSGGEKVNRIVYQARDLRQDRFQSNVPCFAGGYNAAGYGPTHDRQLRFAIRSPIIEIPVYMFTIPTHNRVGMGLPQPEPYTFTDCKMLPAEMRARVGQALVADIVVHALHYVMSWNKGKAGDSVSLISNAIPGDEEYVNSEIRRMTAILADMNSSQFWGDPAAMVSSILGYALRSTASAKSSSLVLQLDDDAPGPHDAAAWDQLSGAEYSARLLLTMSTLGPRTRQVRVPWPSSDYLGSRPEASEYGVDHLTVSYHPSSFRLIDAKSRRPGVEALATELKPQYPLPELIDGMLNNQCLLTTQWKACLPQGVGEVSITPRTSTGIGDPHLIGLPHLNFNEVGPYKLRHVLASSMLLWVTDRTDDASAALPSEGNRIAYVAHLQRGARHRVVTSKTAVDLTVEPAAEPMAVTEGAPAVPPDAGPASVVPVVAVEPSSGDGSGGAESTPAAIQEVTHAGATALSPATAAVSVSVGNHGKAGDISMRDRVDDGEQDSDSESDGDDGDTTGRFNRARGRPDCIASRNIRQCIMPTGVDGQDCFDQTLWCAQARQAIYSPEATLLHRARVGIEGDQCLTGAQQVAMLSHNGLGLIVLDLFRQRVICWPQGTSAALTCAAAPSPPLPRLYLVNVRTHDSHVQHFVMQDVPSLHTMAVISTWVRTHVLEPDNWPVIDAMDGGAPGSLALPDAGMLPHANSCGSEPAGCPTVAPQSPTAAVATTTPARVAATGEVDAATILNRTVQRAEYQCPARTMNPTVPSATATPAALNLSQPPQSLEEARLQIAALSEAADKCDHEADVVSEVLRRDYEARENTHNPEDVIGPERMAQLGHRQVALAARRLAITNGLVSATMLRARGRQALHRIRANLRAGAARSRQREIERLAEQYRTPTAEGKAFDWSGVLPLDANAASRRGAVAPPSQAALAATSPTLRPTLLDPGMGLQCSDLSGRAVPQQGGVTSTALKVPPGLPAPSALHLRLETATAPAIATPIPQPLLYHLRTDHPRPSLEATKDSEATEDEPPVATDDPHVYGRMRDMLAEQDRKHQQQIDRLAQALQASTTRTEKAVGDLAALVGNMVHGTDPAATAAGVLPARTVRHAVQPTTVSCGSNATLSENSAGGIVGSPMPKHKAPATPNVPGQAPTMSDLLAAGIIEGAAPTATDRPTASTHDMVTVLVIFTATAPSPPDVRMYGPGPCAMAQGPRASLSRVLVQSRYLQLSTQYSHEEIINRVLQYASNVLSIGAGSSHLLTSTASAVVPYPTDWPPPGSAARSNWLMIARAHVIPVRLLRSADADEVRDLTSLADQAVGRWHGPVSSEDVVSACSVAAGLTRYAPRVPEETAVGAALWTLLTDTDVTAPLLRHAPNRPEQALPYYNGGRSDTDSPVDLRKLLYFQILNLPGQPLASWPAKSSLQAWHLTIVNYFSSGAVGISFPLLAKFGPRALISNVVTLVIDKSCARFERLRTLYNSCEHETTNLMEGYIALIQQLISEGAKASEQQAALILALCTILLFLRAGPYGRDSDRMARVEIRRLRDVARPEGIHDGEWLIEMDSRLRQWRKLLGVLVCVQLQDELRDFLHNVAVQLSTIEAKAKFVSIVSDMMEAWARQHYRGDMASVPGLAEIAKARRVSVGNSVIQVRDITKITDLYLVHEAGKATGDACELIAVVLNHVIKSWNPDEYPVNLLGPDGAAAPDVVLMTDSADDPQRRAVLASSSVRIQMVKDALSDVAPFPALDKELPAACSRDNMISAMADRTGSAARAAATPRADEVLARLDQLERADRDRQVRLDAHMRESASELAHLGLLARTNVENSAHPDLKHARHTTSDGVHAIATDTTTSATAPAPPTRKPDPRRRIADDARRRNMGRERTRDRGENAYDGNGFRRVLMAKPATKYSDLPADARDIVATETGIQSEADWMARGGAPCVFCKVKDHDMFHCVKLWAATDAGRNWLGSAKAADFKARLSGDSSATLTVGEFVQALEKTASTRDDDADWDTMVSSTMYVCDYCGVNLDESDAPASDLLAFVGHYRDYHAALETSA